jgi:hypothetical protein
MAQEGITMDSVRKPSVLFVYYTYTRQTLKVAGEREGPGQPETSAVA